MEDKKNKIFIILGVIVITVILTGITIGITIKNKNTDNQTEKIVERNVTLSHIMYVKINPILVKIIYDESYKTCNDKVCSEVKSLVQDLVLINEDAEKIYAGTNIKGMNIYESITNLINIAKEKNVDVSIVDLIYNSENFIKEKIIIENTTISGGYSKTIDENDLINNKTQYTISFDSNGGSNVVNQIVFEGDKVSKPTNPTKDGYTFVEWQLDGKSFDFNNVLNENIILVAKWEKNKTPLHNNTNSNNETKSNTDNNSSSNNNPSENSSTNTTPQTSTKKEYTVSFNSNGGSAISNQIIRDGEIANKPNNPVKEGYTFKGWLLNEKSYDFSTPVKSNLVLIASWENNIWEVSKSGSIIKYKGNDENVIIPPTIDGISISNIASNAFSSSNMKTLTLASTINSIEVNAVTKSNNPNMSKVFITESQANNINNWNRVFETSLICWETSNTGTFVMGKMGGNCQSWRYSLENIDDHYFIGYALGTCPNTGDNHDYYLSKEDTPLFNVNAVGYEFEGWTGTGLNKVTKNVIISKGSTGDRSYIAHCREYVWYIKLDYSNYSGLDFSHVNYNKEPYCGTSSSKCKYKYSQIVTIPENQVVNNGYTFVGWSTRLNGDVVYKAGDKVSKLFTTDNATLTLYPVWE